MRGKIEIVCAAVLIAGGGSCLAGEADKLDSNTLFSSFGYHSTPSVDSKSCNMKIVLKKSDLIDKVPVLQKLGILNPDITQTRINQQPNLIAMTFAVSMAPVVTKELYDSQQGVDKCHFVQFLDDVDDYGHDEQIEMFSYNFNRKLHKRVNWDNFDSKNLMKIAPGFHFSPEFTARAAGERD